MLYVNQSPVKILAFILSFTLAILSYQPRAQAGDQSKALIGGAIAAIIAGGIAASQAEPPVASPPQDNSNIAWETPQPEIKKVPSQAEIKEREKVKAIQKALAKINFYGGDIDGIAGSGTSEAIQYWESEFDQVQDGLLTESEFALLKKASANNLQSKRAYDEFISQTTSGGASNDNPSITPLTSATPEPSPSKVTHLENNDLALKQEAQTPPTPQKSKLKIPVILVWIFFIAVIFLAYIWAKDIGARADAYDLPLVNSRYFLALTIGTLVLVGSVYLADKSGSQEMAINNIIVGAIFYIGTVFYTLQHNIKKSTKLFGTYYTVIQMIAVIASFLVIFLVLFVISAYLDSKKKKRYR